MHLIAVLARLPPYRSRRRLAPARGRHRVVRPTALRPTRRFTRPATSAGFDASSHEFDVLEHMHFVNGRDRRTGFLEHGRCNVTFSAAYAPGCRAVASKARRDRHGADRSPCRLPTSAKLVRKVVSGDLRDALAQIT
jgi:hypothetical protein